MSGHCLVKLNSSHVFLTGGGTASSYIYSSTIGFTRQGDMGTPRHRHACTFHGGQVWVAGGTTSEYFSLSTSTWLPGPDLPISTVGGRMITSSGKLTLIGKKKIWQLETFGLDGVDGWTWVEVGEMRRSRYLFDVIKMIGSTALTLSDF